MFLFTVIFIRHNLKQWLANFFILGGHTDATDGPGQHQIDTTKINIKKGIAILIFMAGFRAALFTVHKFSFFLHSPKTCTLGL